MPTAPAWPGLPGGPCRPAMEPEFGGCAGGTEALDGCKGEGGGRLGQWAQRVPGATSRAAPVMRTVDTWYTVGAEQMLISRMSSLFQAFAP